MTGSLLVGASAAQISGVSALSEGQAFRLGEGSQGLLRVFTELAVDFPGRELSPVQKHLGLYDSRIDLVLAGRL